MLLVKQELLAALANTLESFSPGAGAKAAFESPKVAAHGDFASTAAMQLAKPLARKPRELAEDISAALQATPAFAQWVDAIEIAGPGFLNIRLKTAAKQQVVREVLAAGEAFGRQPARADRVLVEFVSANPTGPLHVGHGRQAALGDAICNLLAAQGAQVWREFYYNDAGRADPDARHQHPAARQGLQAGRRRVARAGLQRRIHRRHRRRLQGEEDRALGRPRIHRQRRRRRHRLDPPVRRGLPAPRAGPGPEGLPGPLRQLLPRVQPLHQRPGRGDGEAAGRGRQDLRAGRRPVAEVDRLRRRQGPRDAQGRRQLHLLRARRGLPHRQVGARLPPRWSTSRAPTTTARSRACAPACRPRASASRRATPTTCCTPWCA